MESASTAAVYEQGASVINKVVLIGGHVVLVHGRVMSLPWLSLGRLAGGGRHFFVGYDGSYGERLEKY